MQTRRIAAALLFALLPVTVSSSASAQDDAVTMQARARFKEGVDAFDKGKYEEARLSFLQAYTLKKHPSVLLNLAQSSAKSNHPLEASKYFQQFLKESTNASPQQRKDAEAGLAEVRQKLGRIEVVAPAGTDISLDDQGKVGTTPMDPVDVDPGQHVVKSPSQTVTVTATAGQKVEAKLAAASSTGAPAAAPVAAPEAKEAGPMQTAGADKADATVKTKPGLLSPPENMTPVYIGLGAAGVGLVGAIVFAAFKSDAQSKADTVANDIRSAAKAQGIATQGACNNAGAPQFQNACTTLKDNNSKVDTDATVANISLVVMGAGIAVAGIWYLAAPKAADEKHEKDEPAKDEKSAEKSARATRWHMPVVSPYAGWGQGGLNVAGTF